MLFHWSKVATSCTIHGVTKLYKIAAATLSPSVALNVYSAWPITARLSDGRFALGVAVAIRTWRLSWLRHERSNLSQLITDCQSQCSVGLAGRARASVNHHNPVVGDDGRRHRRLLSLCCFSRWPHDVHERPASPDCLQVSLCHVLVRFTYV